MKKNNLLVIAFLSVCTTLFAGGPGTAWAWGEKEVEAKGTWLNLEKLIQQKKYEDATSNVSWLLSNAPNLNVALYINAIKVYEKRTRKAKNPTIKAQLQDSTLMLYKKRIELFGDEANVLNREGRIAWDYLGKRPGTGDQLYSLYQKIHTLNGNNTLPQNMTDYMKAACTQYVNKKLGKVQMIELYNTCNEVFDAQISSTKNPKKISKVEKQQGITAHIFSENVDINCEDIQNQFGAKFAAKKDLKMAKLIINLSISNKCFANDVFVDAASYLSASKKSSYSLEKILASVYAQKGATEKAITSYQNSMALTDDSLKIGALHYEIAELQAKQGAKADARTSALSAVSFNASLKKAYTLIGNLYFQSSGTCSTGNKVQDRTLYIAAYNMYIKAGNASKAQEAKAQFPSMEEMFLYNQKPGDVVNTGCWISESVKLDKR